MKKMGYKTLDDKDKHKRNKKVSKPMFTFQDEEFRFWESKYKKNLQKNKDFIKK
jgi:hypothetical protein